MAERGASLSLFGFGQVKPRVLVVDDAKENREVLRRRLERLGCEVSEADSGEQALEMLGEADAVLLDINMPMMSGVECLRQIRRTHSIEALPVLMVTARDQSSMMVECLAQGASDYVTKPVDFPVLVARLGTWLRIKLLHDQREQFLRIAGHDLRNPLTQILGTTEVILEATEPGVAISEKQYRYLEGILQAGSRMQAILTDLVDAQMLEVQGVALEARVVELSGMARAAVERFTSIARPKGIRLTLGTLERVEVRGDAGRLDQVLDNLLSNALKFSSPGTEVVVRCRVEHGEALLEVCDAGPGLTEDDRRRAFQRYSRLSARPTGGESSTGLGLWISRGIIEQHGGRIGAISNSPSVGSTFWVRLPLSKERL